MMNLFLSINSIKELKRRYNLMERKFNFPNQRNDVQVSNILEM